MQKIIQKPYLFFFGLVPITLILGFLFKKSGIDFDYYGGTVSINYWSLFLISSVFFALIGFNYFSLKWMNKQPKKWLTIIHVFLQIVSLLLLLYYILQTNSATDLQQKDVLNFILFIAFFIFLIASFIHLINFFLSLFLKVE